MTWLIPCGGKLHMHTRRVMKAHAIQQERFKEEKGIYSNSQMNTRLLRKYAWPDADGLSKLKERMEKLNMSARAFDRSDYGTTF